MGCPKIGGTIIILCNSRFWLSLFQKCVGYAKNEVFDHKPNPSCVVWCELSDSYPLGLSDLAACFLLTAQNKETMGQPRVGASSTLQLFFSMKRAERDQFFPSTGYPRFTMIPFISHPHLEVSLK